MALNLFLGMLNVDLSGTTSSKWIARDFQDAGLDPIGSGK